MGLTTVVCCELSEVRDSEQRTDTQKGRSGGTPASRDLQEHNLEQGIIVIIAIYREKRFFTYKRR